MTYSTSVSAPGPTGYCNGTRALFRTLSLEPASMSASRSPLSGAKPET